jgi:phosphomevalonate kinase
MRILGLVGSRKSGKTLAADYAVEIASYAGMSLRKVSFADPLREMFAREKSITPSMLLENSTKEYYREEMIDFSEEIKAKDPFFFVNKLFEGVLEGESIVIDDIRFIPELQGVYERGGIIYKMETSNFSRTQRGWEFTIGVDDNPSETELGALPSWCFETYGGILYNNRDKSYLRGEVARLMNKHFLNSFIYEEV